MEVEVATAGEGSSSLLLNPLRFAPHLPPPLVVEAEVSKGVGAFKRVEASKGVALEASKGLGAFKEAQVAAAPRLPFLLLLILRSLMVNGIWTEVIIHRTSIWMLGTG